MRVRKEKRTKSQEEKIPSSKRELNHMSIPIPTLPHFVRQASDGVVEYYLDNTVLSSARMCEARFVEEFVFNNRVKHKAWALIFGGLVHDCLEFFYTAKKTEHEGLREKLSADEFITFCAERWRSLNLEQRFISAPQFKAVGGFKGFILLITQYYQLNIELDTLYPVALEIAFGKNKEVPLHEDVSLYPWAPFRLYLAGRLDFIFDDGRRLGPMDHKTYSMLGSNPMTQFEIQEGMTGYIYAMQHVYKTYFSHLADREINLCWMNFIATKATPDNKGLQRMPLFKTPAQLEEYRIRQISTAAKIHQILFQGRPPDFNTGVCTNYFHSICPYQPVHRLGNPTDRLIVLSKDFIKEEWNPERE